LKFNNEQAVTGGILTIPLLSASLAGASVGAELEILEARFFTAIVLLAILTTLPGPLVAKSFVHRMKIHFPAGIKDIDKFIYSTEPKAEEESIVYESRYVKDWDEEEADDITAIYELEEIPEEGLEPEMLEKEAYDMMDVFQDEVEEEEEEVDEEIHQHHHQKIHAKK